VQVARVVEGEPAAFPELLGEGLLAFFFRRLGKIWGRWRYLLGCLGTGR
jgi:hypothetical protein